MRRFSEKDPADSALDAAAPLGGGVETTSRDGEGSGEESGAFEDESHDRWGVSAIGNWGANGVERGRRSGGV